VRAGTLPAHRRVSWLDGPRRRPRGGNSSRRARRLGFSRGDTVSPWAILAVVLWNSRGSGSRIVDVILLNIPWGLRLHLEGVPRVLCGVLPVWSHAIIPLFTVRWWLNVQFHLLRRREGLAQMFRADGSRVLQRHAGSRCWYRLWADRPLRGDLGARRVGGLSGGANMRYRRVVAGRLRLIPRMERDLANSTVLALGHKTSSIGSSAEVCCSCPLRERWIRQIGGIRVDGRKVRVGNRVALWRARMPKLRWWCRGIAVRCDGRRMAIVLTRMEVVVRRRHARGRHKLRHNRGLGRDRSRLGVLA